MSMDLVQRSKKERMGICVESVVVSLGKAKQFTLLTVTLELCARVPHGVEHCDRSKRRLVLIIELSQKSVSPSCENEQHSLPLQKPYPSRSTCIPSLYRFPLHLARSLHLRTASRPKGLCHRLCTHVDCVCLRGSML